MSVTGTWPPAVSVVPKSPNRPLRIWVPFQAAKADRGQPPPVPAYAASGYHLVPFRYQRPSFSPLARQLAPASARDRLTEHRDC
jgi:hypothetical protein